MAPRALSGSTASFCSSKKPTTPPVGSRPSLSGSTALSHPTETPTTPPITPSIGDVPKDTPSNHSKIQPLCPSFNPIVVSNSSNSQQISFSAHPLPNTPTTPNKPLHKEQERIIGSSTFPDPRSVWQGQQGLFQGPTVLASIPGQHRPSHGVSISQEFTQNSPTPLLVNQQKIPFFQAYNHQQAFAFINPPLLSSGQSDLSISAIQRKLQRGELLSAHEQVTFERQKFEQQQMRRAYMYHGQRATSASNFQHAHNNSPISTPSRNLSAYQQQMLEHQKGHGQRAPSASYFQQLNSGSLLPIPSTVPNPFVTQQATINPDFQLQPLSQSPRRFYSPPGSPERLTNTFLRFLGDGEKLWATLSRQYLDIIPSFSHPELQEHLDALTEAYGICEKEIIHARTAIKNRKITANEFLLTRNLADFQNLLAYIKTPARRLENEAQRHIFHALGQQKEETDAVKVGWSPSMLSQYKEVVTVAGLRAQMPADRDTLWRGNALVD